MCRTMKKILKDKTQLDSLNLTASEKQKIDSFKASTGWAENVIKRAGLIKKSVQSNRKMTVAEYCEKRVHYLPSEREFLKSKRILSNGKYDKLRIYNGDEVPMVLMSKPKKQAAKPDERTQLIAPPIRGYNKYRDGTFVPFINCGTLLFMTVIVKGGSTIMKEIAQYKRKYGKWLLPWCNKKLTC